MTVVLSALAIVLLAHCLMPATAMSPVIYTQGHDPCFAEDVADENICYPTRCYHLFNISTSGTDPVPQAGYPQAYTKFECIIETYEVYPGYSARTCKKPMCYCKTGFNALGKAGCSPLKLADCWNQTCVTE